MDKFLIIDGNSLANRAFYALPFLTDSKNIPTGAVYGFANILVKFIIEHKPKYIAVCFDHARKTFRNEIYEAYKGTRKETPEELRSQFPLLKEMLKKMNISIFEQDRIEADDLIGTLAKNVKANTIILSGDRDVLQLVDKNTSVWLTKKGITELVKVDESNIKEIYGVNAWQVIELKSLMGDSSDNIPGVLGVGEKTAKDLIENYDSLDGVYENINEIKGKLKEKLENSKALAYVSHKLATIKTDCEINFKLEDFDFNFPFAKEVRDFFDEHNFVSLLKRMEIFGQDSAIKNTTKLPLKDLVQCNGFNAKVFCFDISKMEFLVNGQVLYVPKEITLFDSVLEEQDILERFKHIFEDKSILKITYDLKKALHVLSEYNINLKGEIFDLKLAEYLVNAGEKSFTKDYSVGEFEQERKGISEALVEKGLLGLYENIELPLTYVLYEMEKNGFKVDKIALDALKIKYDEEVKDLEKLIFSFVEDEFNINSPKQVGEILFDKLGLVAYNNKKKSTGIEVLNEISAQHPIVPLIIRHRKIQKLISTYVDVYQECLKKGEIVHTIFNQALTSTGRLSSSEPNVQNIPVRDEEGKGIRKLFISKFENGSLLACDYNQIELRLLADFSNEQALIEAFNRGDDIHMETACKIFHLKKEDVTPSLRRSAKAINFGVIYGISDFGLSQNIGCSRKEAKEYIDSYFEKFPNVKLYMEQNVEFAKENGFIKTIFGRIRNIPEIKSTNHLTRTFGERVAMNMPLQGSASDIIKVAMVNIGKKLKENQLKSQIILQIHDELVIDVKNGEEQEIEKIIKEGMENVVALKVKLPVSVSFGKNLFECD